MIKPPLPQETFAELVAVVCPSCAAGLTPNRRANGEWQHQTVVKSAVSISFCYASGLRNSKWAPSGGL